MGGEGRKERVLVVMARHFLRQTHSFLEVGREHVFPAYDVQPYAVFFEKLSAIQINQSNELERIIKCERIFRREAY